MIRLGSGSPMPKRVVGAEHHLVGAGDIAKKTQCPRVEQDGVEIEPAKAVERVGDTRHGSPGCGSVGRARRARRRRHARRRGDAGKPCEMAREEQPRHRDRRIGQAADRVQEIVAGQPLVAADVMRMEEERRAARRGHLPERVELGIVEIAAHALGLGRDHRTLEAPVERLLEHPRSELAILQRHGGERASSGESGGVIRQVLVKEARPVGALRRPAARSHRHRSSRRPADGRHPRSSAIRGAALRSLRRGAIGRPGASPAKSIRDRTRFSK